MFSEKAPNTDSKITKTQLYMEFAGTFALQYFASMSVMQLDLGGNIPLGNAAVQMLVLGFMVYAGSKLSGSHFNAAVTLSLCVSKHMSWLKGLAYMGAQFCGSLVAGCTLLLYRWTYHGHGKFTSELGYPHADTENWSLGACFLMEFISTALLVSMVYHTVVNSTKPNELVYGFCISACLGISVVTFGDVTGAALNPWRVIPSAALTGELFKWDFNKFAWIYYLGDPLAGACVGLFWKLCWQVKPEPKKEPLNDEEDNQALNVEQNQNQNQQGGDQAPPANVENPANAG